MKSQNGKTKHIARFVTPLTAQDTSKSLTTKDVLVDAPHKAVEKA